LKRTLRSILLLAPALLSEGCWFRKSPKPSPPPSPVMPAPTTPPVQATQPPAPAKRPVARKPPVPEPIEPAVPVREPVLGQIMTEEQKAEYRRTYETNTSIATRILSSFSTRKPPGEQMETLARIRSFLQQAAEATATDWSLAASLARRAAILATELAGRLE
jgi:hypothetical protein